MEFVKASNNAQGIKVESAGFGKVTITGIISESLQYSHTMKSLELWKALWVKPGIRKFTDFTGGLNRIVPREDLLTNFDFEEGYRVVVKPQLIKDALRKVKWFGLF